MIETYNGIIQQWSIIKSVGKRIGDIMKRHSMLVVVTRTEQDHTARPTIHYSIDGARVSGRLYERINRLAVVEDCFNTVVGEGVTRHYKTITI